MIFAADAPSTTRLELFVRTIELKKYDVSARVRVAPPETCSAPVTAL